ncbi:MAG: FAD:protein FMN transferase [Clostridia bacterium]|nr:FAD:protein FMN transferase [Clostridia bacterium]
MLKKIKGRSALLCSLAAVCAGACVLSVAGCSGTNAQTYNSSSLYMDAAASLSVTVDPSRTEEGYADKVRGEFDELVAESNEILGTLDKDLSTSLTSSELADLESTEDVTYCVYRFNQADPGDSVQIDYYTYDLLRIALEMYEKTDGYYNPAVYYNVIAYGFGEDGTYPEKAGDLPTEAEIEAYTDLAGHFGDVEIRKDEETGAYYATKPENTATVDGATLAMKIDLGGIGKGYATDIVSSLIDEYNARYPGDFKYGYFTFGSSSLAVKEYYGTDDGLYTISLTNPRVYGKNYAQFKGKNFVLSTSGDYEQYYRIDDVLYCHIINPKTGSPINTGSDDTGSSVVTVTLAGGLAVEDDAYTTALMAMGGEQALAYINENLPDLEYVMVTCSGGKYETETNMDSLRTVSRIKGELE